MKCFICSSSEVGFSFKAKNNVELNVCRDCYINLLDEKIQCSNCGKVVNNNANLDAKIGRNGIICSECENRGVTVLAGSFIFRRIQDNFKGYGYKPSPEFYKMPNETDNLYMGIELEIGGLHSNYKVNEFCNNHGGHIFYFKSDASIRGCGCEIVTHPATLAYHESDKSGWRELFCDFNQEGFVSGRATNTGLHIHINRNVLTNSQIKKIDLVVNQWHDLFSCIGRRSSNTYCQYNAKLHSELGHSNDRYQSVNFLNRNTVEFRFFCGTNRVEQLFASLECVKIIVIMSKNITYDTLYEDENGVKNKMKEIMKAENFVNFSKMMVEQTGDTSWAI